jgi:hypothetical protein
MDVHVVSLTRGFEVLSSSARLSLRTYRGRGKDAISSEDEILLLRCPDRDCNDIGRQIKVTWAAAGEITVQTPKNVEVVHAVSHIRGMNVHLLK